MTDEMNDQAGSMAGEIGLVKGMDIKHFRQIYEALSALSEKSVDTAYGQSVMDCWVTIEGREYYVVARPSNNQIKVESH